MEIGVDVGGTRTKVVVRQGDEFSSHTAELTPPDLADRFGEFVADLVRTIVPDPVAVGARVGVVVPGLVDPVTGRAIWSANLGWRDVDLAGRAADVLGVPVVGGHDVRAGLRGEHRHGAARDVDDVLFVPLGTGLASALMLGGRVLAGSEWAGEIGHVLVDPEGPPCGCGRRGCLETYAAGRGIAYRWSHVSGQSGDAADMAALATMGDVRAQRIWREAVEALAAVLAPVVAATGVRRVLVGGGLVRSGELLLGPLRSELLRRLPDGFPVDVVPSALGEWSGAVGAAVLAGDAQTR